MVNNDFDLKIATNFSAENTMQIQNYYLKCEIDYKS